jgi:hypothetical protein
MWPESCVNHINLDKRSYQIDTHCTGIAIACDVRECPVDAPSIISAAWYFSPVDAAVVRAMVLAIGGVLVLVFV